MLYNQVMGKFMNGRRQLTGDEIVETWLQKPPDGIDVIYDDPQSFDLPASVDPDALASLDTAALQLSSALRADTSPGETSIQSTHTPRESIPALGKKICELMTNQ